MSRSDRHLTDEEIVRRVDEGDTREDMAQHLDRCETCCARIAGIEALFSALGTEPQAPTEAEMAAQRDRILAAVGSRPRVPVRRLSRRSVWLPAVAAAALAALLLWTPRGAQTPTRPTLSAPADSMPLPVITDATRAAEEVARAADDVETAERLVETPPLDPSQPDIPAPISDDWSEALEIEADFAELPAADREAILTELASVDFTYDSEE